MFVYGSADVSSSAKKDFLRERGQRLDWKENSGFLNPKRRKESYSKQASNVMLNLYSYVNANSPFPLRLGR